MGKKKHKKNQLPFRVNLLFFVVFLIFSTLIIRLGIVQIVNGKEAQDQIDRTEHVTVSTPVPRGRFFDRNGNIVVDNEPLYAITYTPPQGASQEDYLKIATQLAKYIEKDTKQVTPRDMKDFWILIYPNEANDKITKEDWKKYEQGELSSDDIYKLKLERIGENEFHQLKEESLLEILAIKREFDQAYALTPTIIKKEDVTKEEYALVSEHLEELPGVNVTTDWKRDYVHDRTFRSVLGNITQGLPRDQLDYYLTRSYSRNDRVGVSQLEQQYEDVLRGHKQKILNITDKSGNLIGSEVLSTGNRGSDLVLSIDMDLQKEVEEIISDELLKVKKEYPNHTQLLENAFVVMMQPNTGEVLAMAGKVVNKNTDGEYEIYDSALGTVNFAYPMGSAVKGATILAGLEAGVIEPGTILLDRPIQIKSTPVKKSWYPGGFGPIDDVFALKRSSNVYMFRIAFRMADYHYVQGQAAPINNPTAFSNMRNYFAQFGLGAETGIDLPSEQVGVRGNVEKMGLLMDFAIGQYDTYTPMQMAQYVSTIANGGFRISPRLVTEIREPAPNLNQLGPVLYHFEPEILNRIDMKPEFIDRVKEGFRQVTQEQQGTAYAHFYDAPYTAAAKTGTAETYNYYTVGSYQYRANNLTMVGYAPHDKPEVAFSVVVPSAYATDTVKYSISNRIGRRILDAYFKVGKEQDVEEQKESPEENEDE